MNSENDSQGALTEAVYFILVSMLQPLHGYAVMQNVARLTEGRLALGAGTLYGAINVLLERGWIRSVNPDKDSRKKEYEITEAGRRVLAGEITRLQQLVAIGQAEIGRTQP